MKYFAALLLAILLTCCTTASMSITEDGKTVTVKYMDFHPGGSAVSADAAWEGVGRLAVDRDTNDSQEMIESISEVVESAINPLSVIRE